MPLKQLAIGQKSHEDLCRNTLYILLNNTQYKRIALAQRLSGLIGVVSHPS